MKKTIVSFIVIAYNAGNKLISLLDDLNKQSYNHKCIEVILVDSSSSDNTKEIMYKLSYEMQEL